MPTAALISTTGFETIMDSVGIDYTTLKGAIDTSSYSVNNLSVTMIPGGTVFPNMVDSSQALSYFSALSSMTSS